MISKTIINQVPKQFKKIENNYLMGIIYNSNLKSIRLDLITPDLLTNNDIILIDYKTNLKTIKDISNHIEYILKVEYSN